MMQPIYLDYQASTPLAPEVITVMREYLTAGHGNPHSAEHTYGRIAAEAVENARQQIARAIGARPSSVLFTSGATESNNTAINGVLSTEKNHVVTIATEHSCVLAAAKHVPSCTIISPQSDGLVSAEQIAMALRPDTALVSVMLVNNEIGVIQPITEIAKVCRTHGVLLHVDAAQALGRVDVNVEMLGVDLLSLSAHKIYGPKGIGALYIRRGVQLSPLLRGGGQERNIRSGTLSPMLCAGFGVASEIAASRFALDQERAQKLTALLLSELDRHNVIYSINGSITHRICDNLNLHFAHCAQEAFMSTLSEIAVSASAACSSSGNKGSHVLRALGHQENAIATNMRLSVGRLTTEADVIHAAQHLSDIFHKLLA